MARFSIKMHGRRPPNYERVMKQVHQELTKLYEDLEGRPERLLFHTVILSRKHGGPTVSCWGDPDRPGCFQCEYVHKTEWIGL